MEEEFARIKHTLLFNLEPTPPLLLLRALRV